MANKVKVSRTQSITHLQTRWLAYTHPSGSPTLWLAYVSGSPTYTRVSTLARATLSLSLAYTTASPALSFASYLGHAPTTLTRTECFELRREPPLQLRNCRAAAAAPAPVVPISPASPIRTLLAARASTHPAPLAWAAPSLRSACSCRARRRSRTPVDEPASLRLCQRRRWSWPSRRTPRQLAPAALLAARAAPAMASSISRLQKLP